MSIILALCTPTIKPGAVKSNTKEIITCLRRAKKADLIVFPRLCITGATCGSMYSHPLLADKALKALRTIAASTDKRVILGLPIVKDGAVYDATAIIENGNYNLYYMAKGIFDGDSEALSFGSDEIELRLDDLKIKILPQPPKDDNFDLYVIPSAYPALIGGKEKILSSISKLGAVAVVSSGKGESVSGKIMSGDKIALIGGKESYSGFDEEILTVKVGKIKDKPLEISPRPISFTPLSDAECLFIYELMGRGIAGRMSEIGTDKVILGLSGGLDSANMLVAAVLAFEKRKWDKKNIICVTMRGGASSRRTQDNAAALIEAYGVTGINVPIDTAVSLHMRSIGHDEKDVVFENAQARERTQILLDLSNKHEALMLGTGDLSEICLGWSTFGGDQLSQYNPNCSLTKTAIRKLLAFYVALKHNKAAGKIIEDVLDTPVSPELISGQETEAIIGRYEVHDLILQQIFALRRTPEEAIKEAIKNGISESEAKKCTHTLIKRFFRYQFKRNFGPDGVKLFSYDLVGQTIRSDFCGEIFEE